MRNPNTEPTTDITEEPYRGPGSVVASAGYMYLSHAISAIAGFVAVGALGALTASRTVGFKRAFEQYGINHAGSDSAVMRFVARIAQTIPKAADAVAIKVTALGKRLGGNKIVNKPMAEDTTTAFMFAGGLGAASGWIGSSVWGIAKGHHDGNRGKQQFELAKQEIRNLRETNDNLEKINNEIREKYVEAATRFKDAEDAKDIGVTLPNRPDTRTSGSISHHGTMQSAPKLTAEKA